MPVHRSGSGWKWGNKPKKPTTKDKAIKIGKAAHASGYKKKNGHRQDYTQLQITSITA